MVDWFRLKLNTKSADDPNDAQKGIPAQKCSKEYQNIVAFTNNEAKIYNK
jgi:hypothetical protein